jgi:hypothetical protein
MFFASYQAIMGDFGSCWKSPAIAERQEAANPISGFESSAATCSRIGGC